MENLFINFSKFVHENHLNLNVTQGNLKDTIWITGGKENLISTTDIVEIIKYVEKNKLMMYFDCYDGKLVIFKSSYNVYMKL